MWSRVDDDFPDVYELLLIKGSHSETFADPSLLEKDFGEMQIVCKRKSTSHTSNTMGIPQGNREQLSTIKKISSGLNTPCRTEMHDGGLVIRTFDHNGHWPLVIGLRIHYL